MLRNPFAIVVHPDGGADGLSSGIIPIEPGVVATCVVTIGCGPQQRPVQ